MDRRMRPANAGRFEAPITEARSSMTRIERVFRKRRTTVTSSKKSDQHTKAVGEKRARRPVGAETARAGVPADREDADNLARLMKALGSKNPDFAQGLLQQIFGASAKDNKYDLGASLFTLAVAKASAPKDEIEAMQVTQMAAVHAAMMKAIGELARAKTVMHYEIAARAVNQLARTYTAQMEALKRYRVGVESGIATQNVSVSHGGQAIFTQGSAREPKDAPPALPALSEARQQPMEIISEPKQDLVSTSHKAEPASLSSVRRRRPNTPL